MKPATTRKTQRPACSNCTHVRKDGDDLFCRRHPPTVFLMPDGQIRSAFAPVKPEWDCWEHKRATGGK